MSFTHFTLQKFILGTSSQKKVVFFILKIHINMKKNGGNILFERVLFVIIGLLLIFVCTTGYWVYDSLSQVSESPLPTNLKENRRFIVRDLNSNILKSDNLTYSYLYQNNVDAP